MSGFTEVIANKRASTGENGVKIHNYVYIMYWFVDLVRREGMTRRVEAENLLEERSKMSTEPRNFEKMLCKFVVKSE